MVLINFCFLVMLLLGVTHCYVDDTQLDLTSCPSHFITSDLLHSCLQGSYNLMSQIFEQLNSYKLEIHIIDLDNN